MTCTFNCGEIVIIVLGPASDWTTGKNAPVAKFHSAVRKNRIDVGVCADADGHTALARELIGAHRGAPRAREGLGPLHRLPHLPGNLS